jgi:eukaryotic-like serine/threonine-protein kinase
VAEPRWEDIKLLYEALAAVDATDRVDRLHALSPDLRDALQSLLASGDEGPAARKASSARPPGTPANFDVIPTLPAHHDTSTAPDRIGPYRIIRVVGEGGMGIVYEAEQEAPVRRRVALKLVKWGMDTTSVIGRFESERQALALMSHPNIAGVYDAGATEQGRPYFAMEYVRGVPITEYCDTHRLTIRERVDLFVQVCHGVQHAHQKGIIHRDIKPSNVLVAIEGDRPIPKIIDFGVAKATLQRLTEHTIHTEYGQLIGTPEYMSPEQAEMTNLDIDTRTDVYSLGVLLFELLVGAQPFESSALRAGGPAEIQRRIRETDPPRPSQKVHDLGDVASSSAVNRRADVPTLVRQLRGDLDWIVLKALERDRTRRYGSAAEFSADIQRHFQNEPVLARPPSRIYRLAKFVRRHRSAVVATAAVVAALLAGTAVAVIQANRAVRAEAVATERRQKADALISFMVGDLREQLTAIGRLDVLDAAAAESLEYFAALDLRDTDSASLGTYGKALQFIGLVRIDQGKPQESLAAFERARALAEELTRREPANADFWHQRSDAVSNLGEAYWELKQEARTLAYMSEAADHLRRAIELNPGNDEYRLGLAISYNNLGAVNTRLRHLDAALDWFDRAADVTDDLLERRPDSAEYIGQKVESASWLGELYMLLGRFTTAVEWHEQEITLRNRLVAVTDDPHHRARLADAHGHYARTLATTGAHERAVGTQREHTRLYAELRAHDPTNMMWRHSHEFGLAQLAEYEFDAGDVGTATRRIGASSHALLALLRSAPDNVTWLEAQASVDIILARIAFHSRSPESLVHARRALERLRPLLEEETVRPTVLRTYLRAAIVAGEGYVRHGDPHAARRLGEDALDRLTRWGNPRSVFDAAYRVLLLRQLDRLDEARDGMKQLSGVGFNDPFYRSMLEARTPATG